MKIKVSVAVIAASLMLFQAAACGDSSQKPSAAGDNAGNDVSVSEDAEQEYSYPDVDYGGYEFTFLNFDSQWNCYIRLDMDEQTGESLDDSVYIRNRKVEEKLGISLNEIQYQYTSWQSSQEGLIKQLISAVMSGDDVYDAAYLPVSFNPAVITDGYLLDLRGIPELKLDEPYWDKVINDSLEFGGRLYTASGSLHLMTLDLSWVLLFNQNMMTNLEMEFPYQTVRDGKWTLEKFDEYVSGAVNLNSDQSFAYNENGTCRYGIAGHGDSPIAFIYSAGNRMTEPGADGGFKIAIESDRLYSTLDRMGTLFSTREGKIHYDSDLYEDIFRAGRALFITCELKASLEERDMDDTFGLLPFPKYDEKQENYQTNMNFISCFLTIPITQKDPQMAGVILDALTYESYKTVLPVYYDVTVSQKGLRNEESIEMLDIIHNTRGIEFTQVFGITNNMCASLSTMIKNESGGASSIIQKELPKIESNYEKVKEAFGV